MEEKEFLLETFIRQDNLTLTVTRSEYSFWVWLAMLGGISKIIKQYCAFITDAVSRKMFVNSILSNLFFVKDRKDHDEEGIRREATSTEDLIKLNAEDKKTSRTMDAVTRVITPHNKKYSGAGGSSVADKYSQVNDVAANFLKLFSASATKKLRLVT